MERHTSWSPRSILFSTMLWRNHAARLCDGLTIGALRMRVPSGVVTFPQSLFRSRTILGPRRRSRSTAFAVRSETSNGMSARVPGGIRATPYASPFTKSESAVKANGSALSSGTACPSRVTNELAMTTRPRGSSGFAKYAGPPTCRRVVARAQAGCGMYPRGARSRCRWRVRTGRREGRRATS